MQQTHAENEEKVKLVARYTVFHSRVSYKSVAKTAVVESDR